MIEISSEIYLEEIDDIISDLGLDAQGKALAYSADTAYRYMDKYVPMSSKQRYGDTVNPGDLRRNHLIYPEEDGYVIEYTVPYAHAQYVGFTTGPVKNYTTAGTGKEWDKTMLDNDKEDLLNEIGNYIERKLK